MSEEGLIIERGACGIVWTPLLSELAEISALMGGHLTRKNK
jgi:hypothetical protein